MRPLAQITLNYLYSLSYTLKFNVKSNLLIYVLQSTNLLKLAGLHLVFVLIDHIQIFFMVFENSVLFLFHNYNIVIHLFNSITHFVFVEQNKNKY